MWLRHGVVRVCDFEFSVGKIYSINRLGIVSLLLLLLLLFDAYLTTAICIVPAPRVRYARYEAFSTFARRSVVLADSYLRTDAESNCVFVERTTTFQGGAHLLRSVAQLQSSRAQGR